MVEQPTYPQLVADIVRRAGRPLTIDEVRAQVEEVRTITSRNPRQTVRTALREVRLVETLGGRPARYTWWPRHLDGCAFRQHLIDAELEADFFYLSDELGTLFWTDFRGGGWSDRERVELILPESTQQEGDSGTSTRIAQLARGERGTGVVWSPDLGDWCRERGAGSKDDLIIRVLDPDKQRYAVELQPRGAEALEAEISERGRALAETAHRITRAGRPFVICFEMLPRLISHDVYAHSLPPEPWTQVLRSDLRFVVDQYVVHLASRLVDELEKEITAPATAFAYPRPRIRRDRARSEATRQAWGRYLFDQGMEWRWAGHTREAVAYYKETLCVDPGHADAWVHVGNVRFEEGHVREALPLYQRGEAAALERTIGDPDRYERPFWLDVDSRPYMRALHGQGLCYYQLGRTQQAQRVFERMYKLNPNDNQGVRFLLQDLEEGLSWEQMVEREDERFP